MKCLWRSMIVVGSTVGAQSIHLDRHQFSPALRRRLRSNRRRGEAGLARWRGTGRILAATSRTGEPDLQTGEPDRRTGEPDLQTGEPDERTNRTDGLDGRTNRTDE